MKIKVNVEKTNVVKDIRKIVRIGTPKFEISNL